MAESKTTTLTISPRAPEGSRATRRLRREGLVPGILYGGEGEPVTFAVDARELRNALHASGAVVELTLDGKSTPAVLKDSQHHPVRGETTHVDFVRVNLSVAIEAIVPIELLGAEDSPGAKEGGIVDQPVREVNVEALPTSIPESIQIDVSALSIGETLTLEAAEVPAGVTLVDDVETVIVTVLAPRLSTEDEEGIEEETLLIGESASGGEAEGDSADSGE
ncbi:MAG TPA: 50S ribosomal protein L25 [Solirubrobacteraceae bacterium]